MKERIAAAIGIALAPVVRRTVHPEHYYGTAYGYLRGGLIAEHMLARVPVHQRGTALLPRERLSARLEILCALKAVEIELMKQIKDDAEALADAKAYADNPFLEAGKP